MINRLVAQQIAQLGQVQAQVQLNRLVACVHPRLSFEQEQFCVKECSCAVLFWLMQTMHVMLFQCNLWATVSGIVVGWSTYKSF